MGKHLLHYIYVTVYPKENLSKRDLGIFQIITNGLHNAAEWYTVLRWGSLPAARGKFSGLAFKSLVGSNLVTHSLSEKPSCKNLKSQSSSFFDTAHNSAV